MQVDSKVISEALDWHISSETPISQNIFRYGTPTWGALIRLARERYQLGEITELDADDYFLLESNAGELATFEGQEVMLDTPQPIFTSKNLFVVYVRDGLTIKRLEVEGDSSDFEKDS